MEAISRFGQYAAVALVVLFVGNILRQLLPRNKTEPPAVFHWIPFVGNAVSYGMKPYDFFVANRAKV